MTYKVVFYRRAVSNKEFGFISQLTTNELSKANQVNGNMDSCCFEQDTLNLTLHVHTDNISQLYILFKITINAFLNSSKCSQNVSDLHSDILFERQKARQLDKQHSRHAPT